MAELPLGSRRPELVQAYPTQYDRAKLAEYWLYTPLKSPDRSRTSRDDFNQSDVRLCLRRRDINHALGYEPPCSPTVYFQEAYAVFLGEFGGKYIVAIKDFLSMKLCAYIAYDGMDAVKAEWELD